MEEDMKTDGQAER